MNVVALFGLLLFVGLFAFFLGFAVGVEVVGECISERFGNPRRSR